MEMFASPLCSKNNIRLRNTHNVRALLYIFYTVVKSSSLIVMSILLSNLNFCNYGHIHRFIMYSYSDK